MRKFREDLKDLEVAGMSQPPPSGAQNGNQVPKGEQDQDQDLDQELLTGRAKEGADSVRGRMKYPGDRVKIVRNRITSLLDGLSRIK